MQLSRSEQKRRIKQVEELVTALALLPKTTLAQLPCDPEIRTLLGEVAGLKGGARKRQLKYITKLLRRQPVDALYEVLKSRQGAELKEKREFHETEYLRDALVGEAIELLRLARERDTDLEEHWPSQVLSEIVEKIPGVDEVALLRLARLFALTRNKRHSREIFRLLRAAREEDQRVRKREKQAEKEK